jgi:hypothetical protein
MTVTCPDCQTPAKRVGWRPLGNGLIERIYSCNNGACLRSRLNFSRTTLPMEVE